MRVLYQNRSRVTQDIEARLGASYVSKEQLLRNADHVILVLPYTSESCHTIGAAELDLMKPTATLTNVARGGIADEATLAAALRERRIGAAALDVFEGEPNFMPELLDLPNLVMTQHNAPGSEATRRWPTLRRTTSSQHSATDPALDDRRTLSIHTCSRSPSPSDCFPVEGKPWLQCTCI